MIYQALAIGLILFIGTLSDTGMGDPMLRRPLVVSAAVGLLLGDVETGVKTGAALEVIFLGVTQIGGALPSDSMTGSAFGTAFAILTGQGVEIALSLSVPISMLAVFLNQGAIFVRGLFLKKFNEMILVDNQKGIIKLHLGFMFAVPLMYAFIGFFGIYFGTDAVHSLINSIPSFIMNGLTVAGTLLPALGLSLLLNMLWDKKIAVFMLLGFVLAAYVQMPLIAISLVGIVIAVFTAVKEHEQNEYKLALARSNTSVSDDNEEDFFND